ncbi:beta-lysine 5,6-aminomutase alpha subunit /D-lysine 5,6-aminomutase alpha subunit [Keratinibaculum paraultunense]|uniref:Beta-lysine 5,6-aminomutase alpha subunit /D-lysine 5,6-aminomutase alpha subunit n=1 Tax=Keratinibaculum paraultunense TaxID=1278232 RepID=A0A4R3KV69_9FIRM|nr:lysine 5,6-aminomutase subunit alpha [Keratinibaculum paraultunense]QQY79913.1 lysine 5,6-aminomutase subunit alpha [Keratinibaculum paraultunense]TCS88804.1 beta-lysine 5,6-aminomutase alpha subunit /D-lysine 5,6-aminomutase alpha subunit [Keratinibaculum paraultunense]
MGKLNLDQTKIDSSRNAAKKIAEDMQKFIDEHTTTSTERTIVRLLGIDGIDEIDKPLPNVLVDNIKEGGGLEQGAAYWLGNAIIQTGDTPQDIAEKIGRGELDITRLPIASEEKIQDTIYELAKETVDKIKQNKNKRDELIKSLGEGEQPYLYVIVATGNIYEDIVQAKAAAYQGADVIAVIRTTGQSLLDYVPYGATTEGFGGTYATQENFRLMRKALDEVGEEIGRYIRLCNYCSGLCMPEIAAMGALERLDMMLNDALYGILFRDINMQRTMIDQYFSRVINGYAGIIINTGEDNYLTTDDAVEAAHTVLASQFINEQFARKAGIPEEQMGLGHAFEMDPALKNGFLYELAQAQMAREIFPNAPLKYMPPTKYMTGNIFKGHVQDAMFNMVSIMTGQGIQLLGMLTEAIHTPHIHDRYLAIENAQYIFNNARDLGDEILFKEDGIIQKRAQEVLQKAEDLLNEIADIGLFPTIEQGKFGGVKRSRTGGKGLEGVAKKSSGYFNPFIPLMLGGVKQ